MTSYYRKARSLVRDYGTTGVRMGAEHVWRMLLEETGKRVNYGLDPFERSWDTLVILDACRFDLFDTFARQHDIWDDFTAVEPVYSCASSSREWLEKVTDTKYESRRAETHMISANGWAAVVDLKRFHGVEELWKKHSSEFGTVPPRYVTDATLRVHDEYPERKLLVHYMQPHAPFLHCPGKYDSINTEEGEGRSQNIWRGLQAGTFSREEIWEDYGTNLMAVLDEVQLLVENMAGEIAITADHGNAMGEWRLFGHPEYVPAPAIKRVPWAEIEGKGGNTHTPAAEDSDNEVTADIEEHLSDLGYM